MGQSRFLKVIACLPAECEVPHQAVEDVLQLPKLQLDALGNHQRGLEVDLLHARDPLGALAMSSKIAVLSSLQPLDTHDARWYDAEVAPTHRECRENTSVVLGRMSSRYLLLPTVPSRSLVESFLSRDTRRAPLDIMLSIGIFAFPGPQLSEEPLSLAEPLATSIGVIEPNTLGAAAKERAAVSLQSFLPAGGLRVGRPRWHEGGFVELRSVVEYDALVDALFRSASFQRVLSLCSVQVVLKRLVLPHQSAHVTPIALDSLWLLAPKHAAEFAFTRTTHHPSVVASSTRHYSMDASTRCAAPSIASLMITATSMRELLDQSSWVHDVVLGGSAVSGKFFAPPDTTSLHGGDGYYHPVHTEDRSSYVGDSEAVSRPALRVDPSADHVLPHGGDVRYALQREMERLGRQLDDGESTFQKALATRNTEAQRLKDGKDKLRTLQAALEAQQHAREAADRLRKERVLDLTAKRDDVASLHRSTEELAARNNEAQVHQRTSAKSLEDRRSALLAEHKADLARLAAEWQCDFERAEQSMKVEMQHAEDTCTKELSHLRDTLAAKEAEWKRNESVLTTAMASDAAARSSCESLAKQLESADHDKEQLLHQLRGILSPEHATIASTGGPLHQVVDSYGSLADSELRGLQDIQRQLEQRHQSLSTLKAELSAETAHHDRLARDLQEAVNSRTHLINSFHVEADSHWADMISCFVGLEGHHRRRIEAMEGSARSMWSAQESDSWVSALHSAELRFTDEARQRCHEDVFGITSRIKQWSTQCEEARLVRDRCSERLHAARKKHDDLRNELLGHLESIRGEEHNLLNFLEGKPMLSTGASFPSLEEDERQVRNSIERLRAALATGAVVRVRGEGPSSKKPRAAFAAQLSKSMHVTVQDMIQRVEALTTVAREEQTKSHDALQRVQRRLDVVESELEERRLILQRVVGQTAEVEKQLLDINSNAAAASEEIVQRKARHETIRRQLQADFIAARETSMLHRAEGQAHIRKLVEEEEALAERLVSAARSMRELDELKTELELQNPQATRDVLELRVKREVARQSELLHILQTEHQTTHAVRNPQNAEVLSLLSNTQGGDCTPLPLPNRVATPIRIVSPTS